MIGPPPYDYPKMNRHVTDWSIGWTPSRLLLVPLLSVFANYSGLVQPLSQADKIHVWRTEIGEFFVPWLASLAVGARNAVFMSKTAEQHIVVEVFGGFVPMADLLAC